jgi:hypothetical protein
MNWENLLWIDLPKDFLARAKHYVAGNVDMILRQAMMPEPAS